jgi:hypothetical protein
MNMLYAHVGTVKSLAEDLIPAIERKPWQTADWHVENARGYISQYETTTDYEDLPEYARQEGIGRLEQAIEQLKEAIKVM